MDPDGRCPTCFNHPVKACSRCESVFYCSDRCQSADWNMNHRKVCVARGKPHLADPAPIESPLPSKVMTAADCKSSGDPVPEHDSKTGSSESSNSHSQPTPGLGVRARGLSAPLPSEQDVQTQTRIVAAFQSQASVNDLDERGCGALHRACLHIELDVVQALLRATADVNLRTATGQHPSTMELSTGSTALHALLRANTTVGGRWLDYQARADRVSILGLLIDARASVDASVSDDNGNTVLHVLPAWMLRYEWPDTAAMAVKVLSLPGAFPCLHLANLHGDRPIALAKRHESHRMAHLYSMPEITSAEDAQRTLYHVLHHLDTEAFNEAVRLGNMGIVKKALRGGGVCVNDTDKRGCSALYYAISERHDDVLELLLSSSANLNDPCDERGTVPLVLAAGTTSMIIISMLVKAGSTALTSVYRNPDLHFYEVYDTVLHATCEAAQRRSWTPGVDLLHMLEFWFKHGAVPCLMESPARYYGDALQLAYTSSECAQLCHTKLEEWLVVIRHELQPFLIGPLVSVVESYVCRPRAATGKLLAVRSPPS